MIRKITSVALLVSVIAVGISGIMMIVLDSFMFQLQMHPVHKVFGIIMCGTAIVHIYLNFAAIKSYLKINKVVISGAVLFTLLTVLTVIGMNKPLNITVVGEIEDKMMQLEQ